MKRKIAAIVAADVAGYSRLVAEDEEETIRRLVEYRSVFQDSVDRFGGRIFNTAGDSVLAEFSSAVEALRSTLEVQEDLRKRNLDLSPDRRMSFRIGITIGDVMERDGDLLGDGVNIAARLEGLAGPGGICVSRSVHEQISGKLALKFKDIGPQSVKNIPNPVHAYVVRLNEPDKPARPKLQIPELRMPALQMPTLRMPGLRMPALRMPAFPIALPSARQLLMAGAAVVFGVVVAAAWRQITTARGPGITGPAAIAVPIPPAGLPETTPSGITGPAAIAVPIPPPSLPETAPPGTIGPAAITVPVPPDSLPEAAPTRTAPVEPEKPAVIPTALPPPASESPPSLPETSIPRAGAPASPVPEATPAPAPPPAPSVPAQPETATPSVEPPVAPPAVGSATRQPGAPEPAPVTKGKRPAATAVAPESPRPAPADRPRRNVRCSEILERAQLGELSAEDRAILKTDCR